MTGRKLRLFVLSSARRGPTRTILMRSFDGKSVVCCPLSFLVKRGDGCVVPYINFAMAE